jgi:hypothetical protein
MTTAVDVSGVDGSNPKNTEQEADTVAVPQVSGGDVPSQHPANGVLDEIEAKLNTMGSYAYNELKHMLDRVRGML